MHRWKQRSSAACPRCGEFEDAPHVWQCRGANADVVWTKSLESLDVWMTSVQTDPDIQEAIISHLSKWRLGSDENGMAPFQLHPAIEQQNDIGWNNFLEGWVTFEWELVQQAYYELIQSRRSGLRWFSSPIKNYGRLHGTYGSTGMACYINRTTWYWPTPYHDLTKEYAPYT